MSAALEPLDDQHRSSDTDRVRVLYVAGSGRSGSTLVERMLGQLDGVFAAGEVRYLWRRGLVEDRLCGCGVRFRSCPTWSGVLDEALGQQHGLVPEEVAERQHRRTRAARLPLLLARPLRRRPRAGDDDPDRRLLSGLYRAIARRTDATVVVDSSKLPPYGALLGEVPGVDLYVLHLVRDPRATAFSWSRSRVLPDVTDARLMQQMRPSKSALLWLLWNSTAEWLWGRRSSGRYLRMRYEDFVRDPAGSLLAIAELLELRQERLPLDEDGAVALRPTHSVAGNPSRMRSGRVPLRLDDEWRSAMPRRDMRLVTALTWPLLFRYGYPLRRSRQAAAARRS